MQTVENETNPVPEKPKRLKRHIMLFVALIALALMTVGELISALALSFLTPAMNALGDGMAFLSETYLAFFGIDLVVVLYCLWAEKPIARNFGAARRGGGRGNTLRFLLAGLLAGFVMNALCVLTAYLHGDIDLSLGTFRPGYLLFALVAVGIQSTAEELVTRGYVMGALRERYGVWVAVVFNALFFASLHLFNPGVTVLAIVDIALFGAALSLAMVYLDSIWFCAAVHTAWNFTQNLIFGLPNSGIVAQSSLFHLEGARDSIFYNTGFGVESTVMAVVTECVLAIGVVLWAKRREANKPVSAGEEQV